ncbi:hypothetical protein ACX51_14955 [Lacticaseibacillus paracasei]|uniref:DUF5348 domain-containing protein n=1 Tax=Lacticaseibacillus paracasei TaxID=1597 RepID=A0ABD6VWQ2_LACPA|nr:DUF5348 domain-containing protein [Lacticaseibacillus paracasei]POE38995.1 hypothetical protein ACX51_14955 [Lacticaseibacillus paracasei]
MNIIKARIRFNLDTDRYAIYFDGHQTLPPYDLQAGDQVYLILKNGHAYKSAIEYNQETNHWYLRGVPPTPTIDGWPAVYPHDAAVANGFDFNKPY